MKGNYNFYRNILSRQQHYDWGLRALKSVLRTAGDELCKRGSDFGDQINDAESVTVVRALSLNTLSKLTRSDSLLFMGLVNDMFPGIPCDDLSRVNLMDTIARCYQEMGLTLIDRQVQFIYFFQLLTAIS